MDCSFRYVLHSISLLQTMVSGICDSFMFILTFNCLCFTVYDGNFHCGASLISKDYVLTAAHCVRRLKRSKIRIILGDHDQTVISDADAKMRAVSAVIKHRYFDSNTYNHDIALLKLRKPIEYSKNIMPVCLPTDDFDPAGKTGIAVGWGKEHFYSDKLK